MVGFARHSPCAGSRGWVATSAADSPTVVHGRWRPDGAGCVASATRVVCHRDRRVRLGSGGRPSRCISYVMASGIAVRGCVVNAVVRATGWQPGCSHMTGRALGRSRNVSNL